PASDPSADPADRPVRMTVRIARAAGWDAGNRSMTVAGRAAWNEEDWTVACEVFETMMRRIAEIAADEG
ncbi:MAG: hypothetical protein ACK5YI_02785, partial [Rhodospirillales bacterium]